MGFDAVFPLSPPTWLFQHTLTYRPNDAGNVITDQEGNWHYEPVPPVTFSGYLTAPGPQEVERAAAKGTVLDAVCLCANDAGVTDSSTVEATTGVPAWLVGKYRVINVRPNPSHSRVLLTRIVVDDAPPRDASGIVDAIIDADTVAGGL